MRSRVWSVRFLLVAAFLLSGTRSQELEEEKDSTKTFFSNSYKNKNFVPPEPCDCSCGVRNEETRVVGGQTTLVNEFPWQASLTYLNRFYCGATLINDLYVVTAAHCVKGFTWFLIKANFGEHNRCEQKAPPVTRFVARAFIGNFTFMNFNHDIAVLRLNERVPLSETIRPICLPSLKEKLYAGINARASGWGTLKEDGKTTCTLQSVELPVMTPAECRNTSYSPKLISDNMLCAGYAKGGKDSCQGDSGGPLVVEREDKKFELIGIISWGYGCARPGYPGVYTRVTRYIDWIMDNAKDGCFCKHN